MSSNNLSSSSHNTLPRLRPRPPPAPRPPHGRCHDRRSGGPRHCRSRPRGWTREMRSSGRGWSERPPGSRCGGGGGRWERCRSGEGSGRLTTRPRFGCRSCWRGRRWRGFGRNKHMDMSGRERLLDLRRRPPSAAEREAERWLIWHGKEHIMGRFIKFSKKRDEKKTF